MCEGDKQQGDGQIEGLARKMKEGKKRVDKSLKRASAHHPHQQEEQGPRGNSGWRSTPQLTNQNLGRRRQPFTHGPCMNNSCRVEAGFGWLSGFLSMLIQDELLQWQRRRPTPVSVFRVMKPPEGKARAQ
jgi:hypothetical protein